MTALAYDLTIEQGADFELTIPVLDAAGAAQTVTGWTARAQVRRRTDDPTPLAELTCTCTGAQVVVTVPAATSTGWSWTAGRYQIELEDPAGAVTRLAQGRVVVSPEITR